MESLDYFVNCRKFARKRVTEIHNTLNAFSSYSESDRLAIKGKLNKLLDGLKEYDLKIQSMKYFSDYANPLFTQELETCDDYTKKL